MPNFGIGGCVTIDKVYSFDPMADLTPGQQAHILGVQANLWTEYIASDDHLEYMLLPRLAALSEVQWCQPGGEGLGAFPRRVPAWTGFIRRWGTHSPNISSGSRDRMP